MALDERTTRDRWGVLRRSPLLRYLAVVPIVGLFAAVGEVFYRLTGSSRLSSIFLAGVFLAAFSLGSGPGYASAALAFLVYLYLVDPRFEFSFGGPEDFNAMMLFLAVAVLTSTLAGRMRGETERAQARRKLADTLLAATQEFSASSDELEIRRCLAEHLARAARADAVVRDGGRTLSSSKAPAPPAVQELFGQAEIRAQAGARETQDLDGWRIRGLWAGSQFLGVAGWRMSGGASPPDELTVIDALIDTGAAAISRARLAAAKTEAETRARTEDLRNALLSSISHDLRTPLASIMASASSLKEFGGAFDEETRRDLSTTIEEEAQRLDAFVANLLNMTRLEAGALTIDRSPFEVQESVERVMSRRGIGDRLTPGPGESWRAIALGDAMLFEQALGNVVDNALRYGGPRCGLAVQSCVVGSHVDVTVMDEGPGVAPGDEERIFEKFYRGQPAPRTAGTGLGLSIVRGLMRAMGGDALAANRRHGSGLVVTLRLEAAT